VRALTNTRTRTHTHTHTHTHADRHTCAHTYTRPNLHTPSVCTRVVGCVHAACLALVALRYAALSLCTPALVLCLMVLSLCTPVSHLALCLMMVALRACRLQVCVRPACAPPATLTLCKLILPHLCIGSAPMPRRVRCASSHAQHSHSYFLILLNLDPFAICLRKRQPPAP